MNKIAVIHQPDFAPWLGFFDKLMKSDIYVVLDNVQFIKRGWQHRDKIKAPNGNAVWLTIPVKKSKNLQKINEVLIDYSTGFVKKHLNRIKSYYQKAKFFDEVYQGLRKIYLKGYEKLVDFNIDVIKFFLEYFRIEIEIIYSSFLDVNGKKNELNINILKRINTKRYLSGIGAKNYLDEKLFRENEIEVLWQNFIHPVYPQLHGKFVPNLSVIDFSMNCGGNLKKYLDYE